MDWKAELKESMEDFDWEVFLRSKVKKVARRLGRKIKIIAEVVEVNMASEAKDLFPSTECMIMETKNTPFGALLSVKELENLSESTLIPILDVNFDAFFAYIVYMINSSRSYDNILVMVAADKEDKHSATGYGVVLY
jgi:hypothetical protein